MNDSVDYDHQIMTYKSQVMICIYNILAHKKVTSNITQLKNIDEKINQTICDLDSDSTISRRQRKMSIMSFQEIQSVIDKAVVL